MATGSPGARSRPAGSTHTREGPAAERGGARCEGERGRGGEAREDGTALEGLGKSHHTYQAILCPLITGILAVCTRR